MDTPDLFAVTCTPDAATFTVAPLAEIIAHNRRAWMDSRMQHADVVLYVGAEAAARIACAELQAIRPDPPEPRLL